MNKTTEDERLYFDRHSEAECESINHHVQGTNSRGESGRLRRCGVWDVAKIESQAEQESAVGELITLRVSSGLLGMGMDGGCCAKRVTK